MPVILQVMMHLATPLRVEGDCQGFIDVVRNLFFFIIFFIIFLPYLMYFGKKKKCVNGCRK